MDLSELSQTVSKYAPLLGGVIGGPGGEAIGELVSRAFGGSTGDSLLNAINASPDAALKLKEIESNERIQLQQLIVQQNQVDEQDRASARVRQSDLAKYGMRDYVPTFLALGFLIVYCAVQYMAIASPSSSNDIISARVQDIMVMIITFYFGSSLGSKKKDDVIHDKLNEK